MFNDQVLFNWILLSVIRKLIVSYIWMAFYTPIFNRHSNKLICNSGALFELIISAV